MTAYIICDNDATLHVVIEKGEKHSGFSHAEKVMKKMKEEQLAKCNKHYGTKQGPEEFERHYFHIHRVTCEDVPSK